MKKIVILGPESTGKSTLCAQLAAHYGTTWCPEFARGFLLQLERPYTFDDLLTIAQGQAQLEMQLEAEARNSLYFIDTDQRVMKVWCEVAFGQCHPWILKAAADQRYDLSLLCRDDLPWAPDELREYPDPAMRHKLYLMYKELLVNGTDPWAEVYGSDQERLQRAIAAIDPLIQKP